MSAVRLDRALLPGMIARTRGVIIHVTSGQARLPGAASLPYTAAKAATTVYSKGLANEVGKYVIDGGTIPTVWPGGPKRRIDLSSSWQSQICGRPGSLFLRLSPEARSSGSGR